MSEASVLCCFCSLAGHYRCSVCSAPYCSEQCQTQHWYKHVMNCRAPPPLIQDSKYKPLRKPRSAAAVNKLRLPDLPSSIALESIISPSEMVFLLDPDSEPLSFNDSELTVIQSETLPPLFAVFHPGHKKWVRATQTSCLTPTGLIPVLYTDLGTRGLGTEAKTIPQQYLEMPPRAISAALYEVKPLNDKKSLLNILKKEILDSGREFQVQPMGSSRENHILIRLIDEKGKDLSEELISSGIAQRCSYVVGQDFFENYNKASVSKLILPQIKNKPLSSSATPSKGRSVNKSTDGIHDHILENGKQSNKAVSNNQTSPELVGLRKMNGHRNMIEHKETKLIHITNNKSKRKSLIRQSILDSVSSGTSIEFKVFSGGNEEKNSISVFSCKSKEADRYLNSKMQNESHEKLDSFMKNDDVKVELDGFYYRAIALQNSSDAKSGVNCILADYGSKVCVTQDKVYAPCAKGQEFKACGGWLRSIDENSIIPNDEVPNIFITEVRLVVGGLILVDYLIDKKQCSFIVVPFPYYDFEATLLLGFTSNEIPPQLNQFENDDEINFLSFANLPSEAFLQRKKDEDSIFTISSALYLLDLDDYRLKEDPVKDKIYACKWSDDDIYYRAEVKAINKKASKVKVHFIDYGNSAVQEFSRLSHLPKIFASTPAFCTRVQLKGVSPLEGIEDTINKLSSELESISLTVKLEKEGSASSAPMVTLVSNGNTVNNLIEDVINKSE